MLNLKNSSQADATPQPTPTAQADTPLELISWGYQFKAGKYNYESRHLFSYILRIGRTKLSSWLTASFLFTDLLGEKLISIRLAPDVTYLPREPAQASGEWNVNQFESGEQRMARLEHDDIKATLVIQKVVFSDNTIWSSDDSKQ